MKRAALSLLLCLAACSSEQDRLSDEQAARDPVSGGQAIPAEGANALSNAYSSTPGSPGEVVYRALGNEPGWALTVREKAMLYQGEYGTVRIVEATPRGFSPGPGSTRSGRLTITIAPGPCSDGMSDKLWRDKVTVAVAGGRTSRGCGGGEIVDVNAIENSDWTVSAINGRATGGGNGRYFIRFSGGEVQGAFGCNSFGGRFSRNGDHLFIRGLSATQMACAGPAGSFERDGFAVLRSNMRIEKVDGRTRLVSEAGSVDLIPRQQEGTTT